MGFLHGFHIIFIVSIQIFYLEGRTYNVSTYGAYPNDNNDDSSAVQHAINAAISNGANNYVQFQAGTYDFTSIINIYGAVGLTVLGQCTQQTLLLVHSPIVLLQISSSQQITLTLFSIDFMPLPFTAGYVVNVTSSYLDVQVVSPQLADVGLTVGAILRYDPILMRPAIGSKTYEIYQTPPSNVYTSLVSSGVLRIPLASPTSFVVNDAIIARYSFTTHAITGQDVTSFTLQSLTIYTAWYMGVYTTRTRGLNVLDYHVKPRNGRWMSTSADCMHFGDSRNYINIFDSSCEAQGDDGLNVQAFIFVVIQVLSSTSLIIQENSWPDTLNIGVGTNLEFSHNSTPFTPYATATVASSTVNNANSQIFTFTSSINANVGDMVCVSDTPSLTIRNLTVANNRGRGVLLETRNIQITQSLFNATSSPAVLFQPSLYWSEGPSARNVLLSQNVYINCNEGLYQEEGVIALLPYPVQVVPVIFNVQVTSSTFINGNYSGSMIQCTNGAGVSISGNYLTTLSSSSPITVCNSQNVSAYNNSIVHNQTVISQYFSYDTTNPCLANLSSGINLPASAFNSSFSPPVSATINGVQESVYQTYTCITAPGGTSNSAAHLFVWDGAIPFVLLSCSILSFGLRLTVYC
jgi:hypothetical protein